MENYEQKYKEALEKAKEFFNSPRTCFDINQLTEIFPELRESEDERIKSAAIEFIRQNRSFNYSLGVSKEEAIAWLEKQGEQKSADNVNTYCQEKCKGYRDTGGKCFADGECEAKKKAEQKTIWDKEDERILNKIQDHLREFYVDKKGYPYVAEPDSPEMMENDWLKSLKYRMQPLPKQEWSEEDEDMIECIIAAIKIGDYYTQDELNRMTSWLKSLKPNHWKPSEQNIKDLEWCSDLVKDKMGVWFHRLQVFIDELKSL